MQPLEKLFLVWFTSLIPYPPNRGIKKKKKKKEIAKEEGYGDTPHL